MSKKFLITLLTLIVIGVATGVAVFLAKGYTFSSKEKTLVGTGIITISSQPDSASVYVDGHLTTATNATISSLTPKQYDIKVVKEGFIPWEKNVLVKEGVVTALKITLFPAIPTIYPLTFTGVLNPVMSPDGNKLAYIVPDGKKAGVWVWTMAQNQPISFTRSGSEPHQIVQTSTQVDYSKAILQFAPDSKSLLATVGNNNYLLDSDGFNYDPRDITAILSATKNGWQNDLNDKDSARILTIKDLDVRKIASDSAIVKWSPDETKFMYRQNTLTDTEKKNKPNIEGYKVYDLTEKQQYDLPAAKSHSWLPDSRHIILVEDGKISIANFDGTNKAVIYAGSFQDDFVFPWSDSSRLVIVSSVPTPTASQPNLFGINLK